ncbi:MAG: SAM-dependent methyltransferase [Clostridiales Family XIII bacterium]|jgi:type I restriction-modification system DNA methylase subunit|nr:SAM-dependent methyltransferase [Clostridiales Family XIII bacterium]
MTKKSIGLDDQNWNLEDDVNDWVKSEFTRLGKEKNKDYTVESSMSNYMKESLKGSAKTKIKTNFGKPDFQIENLLAEGKGNNNIPVIIENKRTASKLISETKEGLKLDDKAISAYAVNGAIYYAQNMIGSGKYAEVVAIGCAGDNPNNVQIKVYYVFGSFGNSYKLMDDYTTLDFLESAVTFDSFYQDALLTEEEKHGILIDSTDKLQKYSKELNKLMNTLNITAPQRVLYVSGSLLSMQDLFCEDGSLKKAGLIPEDLDGLTTSGDRDSEKIVNQIKNYLKEKDIPDEKSVLMMSSFNEISKDSDRDVEKELEHLAKKLVGNFISGKASVSKQIFTYIYEHIFKSIDGMSGHLDIMGELYSEFLKYALGDGKDIGIVLTPPYVTKMMAEILDVNKDSKVMDLATGSAGFLISAMQLMIDQVETETGKDTTASNNTISDIKRNQLLGVELNAEMFTLASTNMILRGDGSSNIQKGSSFDRPEKLYTDFKADRLLLNPPFTFEENGMPFLKFGLSKMAKGGKAAIIIQDSAGSGKATKSNKEILKSNQLIASIKMPVDLFIPMAGVQTSIYIVEHTGKPHDKEKQVRFIDFRNDGYKRAKRGITEIDNPIDKYRDIVQVYKNGKTAKVNADSWNLDKQVVDAEITDCGADWNFDQHQIIDIEPTEADFMKVVSDYLAWEVGRVLRGENGV